MEPSDGYLLGKVDLPTIHQLCQFMDRFDLLHQFEEFDIGT